MNKSIGCFLLVLSVAVQANPVPADGLWRTSDDPSIGSGVVLFTQGDQTLVSVFTYDENGDNRWYSAAGQVSEDGVFEAPLLETHNGTYITATEQYSATYFSSTDTIKMTFDGSQIGTVSVSGAPPKAMQAFNFGHQKVATETQQLSDGSAYEFADLTGSWVAGSSETKQSFVLDLVNETTGSGVPTPVGEPVESYLSIHPSTSTWTVNCPLLLSGSSDSADQDFCTLDTNGSFSENFEIPYKLLGNKQLMLNADSAGAVQFQAFKIDQLDRLAPADGLWRTADDTSVGSGIVLRTQGLYSMALVYSYNNVGVATWQIASGMFDENGHFSAPLGTPNSGSHISSIEPMSAVYDAEVSNLVIQLQGTELGTMSIDGSDPKSIQNYKFGVELFETDHLKVNDEAFVYPSQEGNWVLVSDDASESRVVSLTYFDLNWYQSPPNPRIYGARSYETGYTDDPDYNFWLICHKILSFEGSEMTLEFPVTPYCTGQLFDRPLGTADLKTYFEDIGYRSFKYYYGEFDGINHNFDSIDRTSAFNQLFRL